MNRCDFLKVTAGGIFSVVMWPDLFFHCLVRNVTQSWDSGPICGPAKVTIIGIGPMAAEVTRILARSESGVVCHEVIFEPNRGMTKEMEGLFSLVRASDLVFVLSCCDDVYSASIVYAMAKTAYEAGALTIVVVPDENEWRTGIPRNWDECTAIFDTKISVSGKSLINSHTYAARQASQAKALTGFAMRQAVSGILWPIQQHRFIGVDFYDIALVMRSGNTGWLGVGTAAGFDKELTAPRLAVSRLVQQGAPISDVSGVLVCVCGSSRLSRDTFYKVSEIAADFFPPKATIIVGPAVDEKMDDAVSVSIFALTKKVR